MGCADLKQKMKFTLKVFPNLIYQSAVKINRLKMAFSLNFDPCLMDIHVRPRKHNKTEFPNKLNDYKHKTAKSTTQSGGSRRGRTLWVPNLVLTYKFYES